MNKFIDKKDLIIVLAAALIIRLFFAQLDPFLHEWDERYHALVAKNMMDNPFVPKLRANPVVPYDINSWCCNSIWLHKQPLFMWQMALSMKIFGVSEFTMRLPSVLLGTLMIALLWRISLLLTNNKQTSIIAALLLCFSNYQLEQTSGAIGMDHNDVAFAFYILASIWAFCEKTRDNKLIWNILIGVFAGLAVLNKWLVGLLVFFPWGLIAIKEFVQEKNKKELKLMSVSVVVSLFIFIPWQWYILDRFPDMALFEYKVNNEHLWTAVHGHAGSIFYYLKNFDIYFGQAIWLLVPVGMIYAIMKKSQFNKVVNFCLLISFVATMFFFSVIAQTKLPSYVFIVVPIGIIYLAIIINEVYENFRYKSLGIILITACLYVSLNPLQVYQSRKGNTQRNNLIYNTKVYKSLKNSLPEDVKVIININSFEDIDVMFFNDDVTAYHWWFDPLYLDSLANDKVHIGAFKNHKDYILPDAFNTYPYLHWINEELK